MSSKSSFNDSAREVEAVLKQKIEDVRKERNRKLEALEKEQNLRKNDDMEKAKQKILREQNSLDCNPSYARRKPLTAKQLEEQAERVVETKNLKEANLIRGRYKHEIMALENGSQHGHGQPDLEQKCRPRKITGVFNDLPKDRDSNELER